MLERIFKRVAAEERTDPAVAELDRLGLQGAVATLVQKADGSQVNEEIGPVTFCRRQNKLYTRGRSLFLVPPESVGASRAPLSPRGDVLSVRFYHRRVPYSLSFQVVQRVRFSTQLRSAIRPRASSAYRLDPVGNAAKEEKRSALRFAHLRGVQGPQAYPNLKLDLFVERLACSGMPHERLPEILAYPGDSPVPDGLEDCNGPNELVDHFRRTLVSNPGHMQGVHVTRVCGDSRFSTTRMEALGHTEVLGLKGESNGFHVHIRNPFAGPGGRRPAAALHEGDLLALHYTARGWVEGTDTHYRWLCRVHRRGIEAVVLRPKGPIRRQTGLRSVVRDFGVGGVCIQSGPLLETYLLGDRAIPDDPEEILDALDGSRLLLHFHPKLSFPNELAPYKPSVPAAFSLIGQVVRGRVHEARHGVADAGHARELGIRFTHDPADYCPETLGVRAWEPLRVLRENAHFKEIHRALNSMIAYLDK